MQKSELLIGIWLCQGHSSSRKMR